MGQLRDAWMHCGTSVNSAAGVVLHVVPTWALKPTMWAILGAEGGEEASVKGPESVWGPQARLLRKIRRCWRPCSSNSEPVRREVASDRSRHRRRLAHAQDVYRRRLDRHTVSHPSLRSACFSFPGRRAHGHDITKCAEHKGGGLLPPCTVVPQQPWQGCARIALRRGMVRARKASMHHSAMALPARLLRTLAALFVLLWQCDGVAGWRAKQDPTRCTSRPRRRTLALGGGVRNGNAFWGADTPTTTQESVHSHI